MPKAVFVVVGKSFTGEVISGFFPEGPKVVKFVFSHLKLRKQPFLFKFFKPRGTNVPFLPFRRPWLCLNTQCSNNNNLAYASFLVFDDNNIFVCCSANREWQSLK